MLKDFVCWSCALACGAMVVSSTIPEVIPFARPAHTSKAGTRERNVNAIVQAIIGQESGWNYRAVNPHSGALGFAQVMPSNVGPWSKEAGLGWLSTGQFINSPETQKRVIYFKIGQYYDEALKRAGGDTALATRMVASAWYSGQYSLYDDRRPQPYNGVQYPSIAYYTTRALTAAKRFGLK